MTRRDLVHEALRALAAHRLRATLSSIGLVFGVATVVAAFAIGEGARRQAVADIGALGIDNVYVRSVRPPAPAGRGQKPPAPTLASADARALGETIPDLVAVAGVRAARVTAVGGGRSADAELVGVTPSWRQVARLRLTAGRWLREADVAERRRVVVVGVEGAKRMFGGSVGVGARVRADGDSYEVVGLFADDGSGGTTPIQRVDPGRTLLVPISAMDLSLGQGDSIDRLEEIAMRASGAAAVARAARLASAVLQRRHGADQDYEIVVPRELLQARLRSQRTFNAVLTGIGALSLLISGIGIMNIMLASVTERTAEIGVRRAFGATRRDVIAQFAAEAGILCTAGGVVGLVVGAALAGFVAVFAGWPVAISPLAVLLALALSTLVGLGFGIYPARLASLVEPIDALRAP